MLVREALPAAAPPPAPNDVEALLRGLPWRLVLTKPAFEDWARLPDRWR